LRQPGRPILCVLAALLCLLAAAEPARAATQSATVTANVVKPLTVTWLQDLDLGTLTLGPGVWSNSIVGISKTGVFSCGANITCTGASKVARYNASGSNNQTVRITAPNVTMVNQSDPTKTLTLTVDNPGSVVLTNSGPPGTNFSLGGSITLSSSTAGGTYKGTFNVTCDYQ
jgi:Domain of unknown function (DUF4402)